VYVILEDGSKQYQVSPGDTIDIETRTILQGQNTIEFDRVLLLKDDKGTQVGAPIVLGAKVTASIKSPVKGPKIKMLKLRRRKNSSTRAGHRQKYLRVTIDNITVSS
jgi:large subunit ribosomal protein L21